MNMAIGRATKTRLTKKDMEQHREYMKKYRTQSCELEKQEMQYKDHYELLGIPRDASHTEVSLLKKKNETLGPLTKTH